MIGTTRATAKRDLEDLSAKKIVRLVGSGRGSHYEFLRKRLINGSNGSGEWNGRKFSMNNETRLSENPDQSDSSNKETAG